MQHYTNHTLLLNPARPLIGTLTTLHNTYYVTHMSTSAYGHLKPDGSQVYPCSDIIYQQVDSNKQTPTTPAKGACPSKELRPLQISDINPNFDSRNCLNCADCYDDNGWCHCQNKASVNYDRVVTANDSCELFKHCVIGSTYRYNDIRNKISDKKTNSITPNYLKKLKKFSLKGKMLPEHAWCFVCLSNNNDNRKWRTKEVTDIQVKIIQRRTIADNIQSLLICPECSKLLNFGQCDDIKRIEGRCDSCDTSWKFDLQVTEIVKNEVKRN